MIQLLDGQLLDIEIEYDNEESKLTVFYQVENKHSSVLYSHHIIKEDNKVKAITTLDLIEFFSKYDMKDLSMKRLEDLMIELLENKTGNVYYKTKTEEITMHNVKDYKMINKYGLLC